jgi:hypothetical protein
VRLILLSAYLSEDDASAVRGLNLVSDVVRKTNPIETARRIIAEVSEASKRANDPTNWVEFAQARGRIDEVNDAALGVLDSYLRATRLPGSAHE